MFGNWRSGHCISNGKTAVCPMLILPATRLTVCGEIGWGCSLATPWAVAAGHYGRASVEGCFGHAAPANEWCALVFECTPPLCLSSACAVCPALAAYVLTILCTTCCSACRRQLARWSSFIKPSNHRNSPVIYFLGKEFAHFILNGVLKPKGCLPGLLKY